MAKTPLLPTAVNNEATMPTGQQKSRFIGEEVIDIVEITSSQLGEKIFDKLITSKVVSRLSKASDLFQRVIWRKAEIHIVPLNGSTTTAGYTAGFVEDPEIVLPTGKALLRQLTSMRSTVVRQAWVAEQAGKLVAPNNLPEMYTQQGSDLRRFAIGRVVIAAGGNITNAVFQVMLKYVVDMFVPIAISPDFTIVDHFEAPETVNNANVDLVSITLPQTNNNRVVYGADVVLSDDLFCTDATGAVTVTNISILRAGTLVKFRATNDNYTVVDWDERPEGVRFYVTQVYNIPNTNFVTIGTINPGLGGFRTWVTKNF